MSLICEKLLRTIAFHFAHSFRQPPIFCTKNVRTWNVWKFGRRDVKCCHLLLIKLHFDLDRNKPIHMRRNIKSVIEIYHMQCDRIKCLDVQRRYQRSLVFNSAVAYNLFSALQYDAFAPVVYIVFVCTKANTFRLLSITACHTQHASGM